jgi:hypothetical protein
VLEGDGGCGLGIGGEGGLFGFGSGGGTCHGNPPLVVDGGSIGRGEGDSRAGVGWGVGMEGEGVLDTRVLRCSRASGSLSDLGSVRGRTSIGRRSAWAS